jgi:oligopeptidase A
MRLLASLVLAIAAFAADNPLLNLARPIPFTAIKPAHVGPAIDELLKEAEAQREAIANRKGPRTWANTMQALEDMGQRLSDAFSVVAVLEGVATTKESRAAFNAALPKVSAFGSSLSLDARIANAVKEYATTSEAKSLTGPRARLVAKTLDDFRRAGAYLDNEKRTRLQKIDEELSELSNKFGQNALDSRNEFELIVTDEKRLAGLPDGAKQAARASAKAKGKEGWRLTLAQPIVIPVMKFVDDASIRETLWRANNRVAAEGKFDNRPVIARQLALRAEQAKLLGYGSFADLQTENRMAKSGARVKKFLDDLDGNARGAFEKEMAELAAFRKSLEGPSAPPIQPWDEPYYAEKLRQKLYAFDDESVRPYFPMPRVMDGMFTVANRLYGVKVTPVDNKEVWDPSVTYYEIRDADGTHLAGFYADFFPRENKRAGAWMNGMILGGPGFGKTGDRFVPHIGMIAANVATPIAGKPALLNHQEVTTLFHEFGHLLHQALSRSPIKSIGGTNVAWDFVELPSQIMENFVWERPVLDFLAKHYETGESLPDSLFESMKKARTFRAATRIERQVGFAMADVLLHSEYRGDDAQGDPVSYARKIVARFAPAPLPNDYSMLTSFSHVFAGGYAAGYYSYHWSEVLDADAFTRFQKEGLLSSKVGDAFRRAILERGSTAEADKLFRDFMGRDPDVKPMLQRNGLDIKQNMK